MEITTVVLLQGDTHIEPAFSFLRVCVCVCLGEGYLSALAALNFCKYTQRTEAPFSQEYPLSEAIRKTRLALSRENIR